MDHTRSCSETQTETMELIILNLTSDAHHDLLSDIDEHNILVSKLGPKRRSAMVTSVLLFIYCVIFMTGVVGNLFTCAVISRFSYMRTSTNYYLFSLAVSDVLLLVMGLPPEAYSIWESYPWRFGKAFCIIKALFAEMTSYASVLTITAFTIERYIAICKPLKSHKIVAFSRCIKIIIAIWVISLCCALPYPIHTDLFYYVKDENGKPIEESLQCNIPPKFHERMTHVFQLSTFVFFVFPLTVIVVLYSLIGYTLRKADLSREPSDKRYQGNCHHTGQGQHDRSPTLIARRSVLKVLVAVVVAFFVCWAPFHAQRLLTVFNKNWTPLLFDVQSSLFYVSGVLYFVGSTVNPILYNVMSRRYRLAFLETICHNRTSRRLSSFRQTNGGTSLKPKQNSFKGSLKYFPRPDQQGSFHHRRHGSGVCRHIRGIVKCSNCENEETSKTSVFMTKPTASRRGNYVVHIPEHAGCQINHKEYMEAEKKHVARCASVDTSPELKRFECTNVVDIQPVYQENESCEELEDYHAHNECKCNKCDALLNGNANQMNEVDYEDKEDISVNKHLLKDRNGYHPKNLGVFV